MGSIGDILAAYGDAVEPSRRGGWVVRVPTERRGAVAVHVAESERTVTLRAFVFRGPDRQREAVYRRLLEKNLAMRHWRFALDADGDVVAAADIVTGDLDDARIDGLLGALSVAVDEVYEGILQTGFGAPPSRAPN